MGSAKVIPREVDLSTRVPSFPGLYAGIAIAAKKGPVGERYLITSQTQLLSVYTPDEKINVGWDNAFWSAHTYLQEANKLWVSRAVKNALYAGLVVKSYGSSYSSYQVPAGMSDPEAFTFDELPDVAGVAEIIDMSLNAQDANALIGKYFLLEDSDGTVGFWFSHGGASIPAGASNADRSVEIDTLIPGESYSDILPKITAAIEADAKFSADNTGVEDIKITDTETGARTQIAAGDSGFTFTENTAGVTEIDNTDDCLLIYGANQGAWANNVGIKITTYTDDPDYVKEPAAFIIDVYKSSNENIAVESHLCSRVDGAKDGYNNNIFVEDVLEGSNYIRGFSNPSVDEDMLPKDISSILYLASGSDGTAVTDSERITAIDLLNNPQDIPLTLLMDGGNATAAYASNLITIAETKRKDCVAILSTNISDEASATYINDIIDYRKTTLNANSSYASLNTPHAKIYDNFNNRNLFAPPDAYAAVNISKTADNYEIWYPAAGYKRGGMNVIDLRRRFTEGEMDLLYDAGINPFKFVPGKGIYQWGQKTLLSRPSALDRLNVRLLFITIEPAIKLALEDFLFEINDAATRAEAKAKVDYYMDGIVARRGCYDYRSVCDESNNLESDIDNNIMNFWLFVQPSSSVEEIPFLVGITNQSLSFDLAVSLV